MVERLNTRTAFEAQLVKMLQFANLPIDRKYKKGDVMNPLRNLLVAAQGPPVNENALVATRGHLTVAREFFSTNELLGPFDHGAIREQNEERAILIEEGRVRAMDEHGPLTDTGIGQQADRVGMRDRHQGLTNQEERKEPNEPIKNAEDLHKLHCFIVSHKGDQVEFEVKDFDELREFTSEDFELFNTDYHFRFKAQERELMIKNQRHFSNLVKKYAVENQSTLLEVRLAKEQQQPAQQPRPAQ